MLVLWGLNQCTFKLQKALKLEVKLITRNHEGIKRVLHHNLFYYITFYTQFDF